MDDLATVRAQIKSWERSFKEQHGCPPTVNDIKENKHIAEKYKQYKKLSKAASAPQNTITKVVTNSEPITPPRKTRPKEPPSLLLSKSRAIQPSVPLTTFNPFSPEKKQKGKGRETITTSRIKESRSKPFGKSQPSKRVERQTLSPDPFPPIHDTQPSSSASTPPFALHLPLVPTSAVSRARKRLRGEPVSPSPIKDKRRRITSQTTIPFPRLTLDAPSSDDDEDAPAEADSSFVDNSPIKPSTNKNFPRLFEEEVEEHVEANTDAHLEDRNKPLVKKTNNVGKSKATQQGSISRSASRGLATTKLESKIEQQMESHQLLNVNVGEGSSKTSSSRSSTKRPFSDDEEVNESDQPRAKSPLIPPSPPSNSSSSFNRPGKYKPKLKGRTAKGNASQKKLKLNGEHAEDDSDELQSNGKLRIVGRDGTRLGHVGKGPDEDYVSFETDPILGYARFSGPRASSPNDARQEDGNVEIDLPDQLRRVLALQTTGSKVQVSEEDRLVKGLLYGRRTSYYDPMKGGEIWDVGEDHQVISEEGAHKYTEDEEDWEGEPVPWETGEL